MRRKKVEVRRKRQSKTENFLQRFHNDNSMVEYLTSLCIMNPAAQLTSDLNQPRREGGFVRLAHARDEFTAPVLTKGKSVVKRKHSSRNGGKSGIGG